MNKIAVEELARLAEVLEGHGLAAYAEQVDDLLETAVEIHRKAQGMGAMNLGPEGADFMSGRSEELGGTRKAPVTTTVQPMTQRQPTQQGEKAFDAKEMLSLLQTNPGFRKGMIGKVQEYRNKLFGPGFSTPPGGYTDYTIMEGLKEMGLIRGAASEQELLKEANETPEQRAQRERYEFAQKGLSFLGSNVPAGDEVASAGAGSMTTTVQPMEAKKPSLGLGPGYEREFLKTLNPIQVQNVLMDRLEKKWRQDGTWKISTPPNFKELGITNMNELYDAAEKNGIIPKG